MAAPNFKDKTIWAGDNLYILRGMNSECVDLIYLDPPFNSNRDYAAPVGSQAAGAAFKDTWKLSPEDDAWLTIVAESQPAVCAVIQTARATHGRGMQSYLTMMAVRLLEMRRVLKPDGSIYLHCDPTASHYLKLVMDAVFGAGNFRKSGSGPQGAATQSSLAASMTCCCSTPGAERRGTAHTFPTTRHTSNARTATRTGEAAGSQLI